MNSLQPLPGPLGELFDHGMDSISTFLVWLSVGLTIQAGHEPYMLFVTTIVVMCLFYLSHWVNYVTGSMCFAKFDVIEIQFCAIIIFGITGALGHEFWSSEFYHAYSYRQLVYCICIIASVNAFVSYIYIILEGKDCKNYYYF